MLLPFGFSSWKFFIGKLFLDLSFCYWFLYRNEYPECHLNMRYGQKAVDILALQIVPNFFLDFDAKRTIFLFLVLSFCLFQMTKKIEKLKLIVMQNFDWNWNTNLNNSFLKNCNFYEGYDNVSVWNPRVNLSQPHF